jgi:hypothetical protein
MTHHLDHSMAGIERVRFCLFRGFLPEKRQSYCTKSGLHLCFFCCATPCVYVHEPGILFSSYLHSYYLPPRLHIHITQGPLAKCKRHMQNVKVKIMEKTKTKTFCIMRYVYGHTTWASSHVEQSTVELKMQHATKIPVARAHSRVYLSVL